MPYGITELESVFCSSLNTIALAVPSHCFDGSPAPLIRGRSIGQNIYGVSGFRKFFRAGGFVIR
jgi:hypothetical protein